MLLLVVLELCKHLLHSQMTRIMCPINCIRCVYVPLSGYLYLSDLGDNFSFIFGSCFHARGF
uniref:Uncharacterized protein MANES_10G009000 n=1 Tax=Rhizophora mucronata TaxID=61149 RepID=A0A2P2L905_RHIMU